jgi:hypothetical protein
MLVHEEGEVPRAFPSSNLSTLETSAANLSGAEFLDVA